MKTETNSNVHLAAPRTERATVSNAHGVRRVSLAKVGGSHLSEAPNAADFLGGIVQSIARAQVDVLAIQRTAYVKLLQRHDWSYEFADDASVYRKGRDERDELRMVQRELDADYSIWNAHAPDGHKRSAA